MTEKEILALIDERADGWHETAEEIGYDDPNWNFCYSRYMEAMWIARLIRGEE